MKLKPEQITELKALVSDMVDYHETYQELYDHILTALEKKDQNIEFLDAVDAIVDEDFGSYECLFKTEDERLKIVSGQIIKQQQRNFIGYLKLPMIILTVAIGVFFYFATNRFLELRPLQIALMITAILPLLIIWVGKMMLAFKDCEERKRSVRDVQIQKLAYLSFCVMQMLISASRWFFKDIDGLSTFMQLHSAVIATLFTVYVVYVLSFFKLYRQEFKMQLT